MELLQWSKFDRLTFLSVVKLREKGKVNDDSFILLSQGRGRKLYIQTRQKL